MPHVKGQFLSLISNAMLYQKGVFFLRIQTSNLKLRYLDLEVGKVNMTRDE